MGHNITRIIIQKMFELNIYFNKNIKKVFFNRDWMQRFNDLNDAFRDILKNREFVLTEIQYILQYEIDNIKEKKYGK